MTSAWFADHVTRNDIDLERSPRWTVDGNLAAVALLAIRAERGWIGGFGVAPAFRGHGMGGVCVADVLRIARDAGAATLELEVLEHNVGAIRLYERSGFEQIDELIVWRRERLSVDAGHAGGAVSDAVRDAVSVASIARKPATCWQREPQSIAAASPFVTLTVGNDAAAYAFVRPGETCAAALLDAGASDEAVARTLFAHLDARFGAYDLTLPNEPSRGPLYDAILGEPFWDQIARQRRMRIALR